MAINARCKSCKSSFNLQTKTCPNCGTPLTAFRVRVKFPGGRTLCKQTGSLKQARTIETRFKTNVIDRTVLGIFKVPTFGDAFDKYLEWARRNKRSWKDDESRYRLHVEKPLSRLKLDQVAPKHVQSILDSMADADLSPATQRQVYQIINRVYSFTTKQGEYQGSNPCLNVEIPRVDNEVTRYLTPDELHRLKEAIAAEENTRTKLVIRFALFTGRRRGEILKLKWTEVDLDRGMVTYRGTTTKNKTTQTLPVCQEAQDILREAAAVRVSDLVFPCASGRFYHSFNRSWYRVRSRAKLDGFRFHDLRHSFASFIASSGKVDLYTLQKLLGHKSITMTQRYAHLFPGALQDAVSVMDEIGVGPRNGPRRNCVSYLSDRVGMSARGRQGMTTNSPNIMKSTLDKYIDHGTEI